MDKILKISNPKRIPLYNKKISPNKNNSFCRTVYSLEKKYCTYNTVQHFLESPSQKSSPLQIFNTKFQLGVETNPPPMSFTPPENNKSFERFISLLKRDTDYNNKYKSVVTENIIISQNEVYGGDMIFILDNEL